MFRHLTIAAAALLLITSAPRANAKRYLVKRDPTTGKAIIVDPNESLLSRVTTPVLSPVIRPIVRAKTYILGKDTSQARGQIKGFGGPLSQQGMMEPTGIGPKVGGVATRTVDVASSVVPGGQTARQTTGFFTRTLRKAFGGSDPRPAPSGRSAGNGK